MPPRRTYTGWSRAHHWALCEKCGERIEVEEWIGLAHVPDIGRRWVHEECAIALGPAGTPTHPERDLSDTGTYSVEPGQPVVLAPPPPVRIGVLGSGQWPKDRAVEVRDAIEALARGHREVIIVRTARTDHRGRLCGVDAWSELTATRLGYTDEPHPDVTDVLAAHLDLAVAFPLHPDTGHDTDRGGSGRAAMGCDTRRAVAAAEAAGIPVFTHARPAHA